MKVLLPFQSALAVLLAASVALAGEREKRAVRPLFLSEPPTNETHRIHVKGQIITTLRFETFVDPARTKMIGWEGRLEPPAVVRNKVILEPTHDLDEDEAIPLVVTLVDGTELPFLLRPPSRKEWGWTDQQVNVFKDRESSAATHAALSAALKRNDALASENERYRSEETSEDHALAALGLGLLEAPARLYGRVWTSGPQATIRYYEAQPVRGGNKIPICAVARLGFGQLRKQPQSQPGTAILESLSAAIFIVDDFR